MSQRLGKIEKFIMLNIFSLETEGHEGHFVENGERIRRLGGKDRSQILYSLYCIKNERIEMNFKSNIKKALPPAEYRKYQALITRSSMLLEEKGYLGRGRPHTQFPKRKLRFYLTEEGRRWCQSVMKGRSPTRSELKDLLFASRTK
jgi:hypothetical protein